MSARIEERITAVEERMSARIEKTETALLTEFHKWASPVAEWKRGPIASRSSRATASFCVQAVQIILRLIEFA